MLEASNTCPALFGFGDTVVVPFTEYSWLTMFNKLGLHALSTYNALEGRN